MVMMIIMKIIFAEWLTNEWPEALFTAGTIVRDSLYHKSPTWLQAGFEPVINVSSGFVE